MNNILDKAKYFPTLVHDLNKSVDSFEKIQKLHALPQKTQDLLLSDEIGKFIFGVEQRYHLQDAQTEDFSRNVRKYFFREITEGDFVRKISTICNTSLNEALKLLSAIKVIKVKTKNEVNKNYIKLPFNKAIKKYPQILNQKITQKAIISKPFLKPLKPTIKNWVMVYEKVLDVSKHSVIERGEFVFRSQATKGLSEKERQNLLTLFKSRDEEDMLIIDTDTGKVIFDNVDKIINNTKQQNISKKNIKLNVNKKELQKDNDKNKYTLNYIPHNFNNVVTNKPQEKEQKQISKQEYLSTELQEEIKKNKVAINEFTDNKSYIQKKNNSEQKTHEKLGSVVYEIDKFNNKHQEQHKEFTDKTKTINKQRLKKIKTPIRSQNEIGTQLQQKQLIDKPKKAENKQTQDKKQNKQNKRGEISFSSNHVLPVEKDKNKQKTQQQNQYNTFNIKPIGQAHNLHKDK